MTFWTGNHPLARGEGDLAANPEIKQAELEFRRAHPGLTAEALEPLYYRDALGYIARAPGLVDEPARSQGVLHRRCPSARRMRYTRPDIVPRRQCRICSCCRLQSRARGGSCARHEPPDGAVPAGRLRRAGVPRVFSAGAIPDSRDRSDTDRLCCRRWRAALACEHAAERPRRRPDLQRAREPAGARARRARARRLPHAGRRRRLAGRHRRSCRSPRRASTRAGSK